MVFPAYGKETELRIQSTLSHRISKYFNAPELTRGWLVQCQVAAAGDASVAVIFYGGVVVRVILTVFLFFFFPPCLIVCTM